MSHIKIREGERAVMKIRPSWLNFIHHYVISIVAAFSLGYVGQFEIGITLAVLILLSPPLARYSRLYTITTCRVVERKGLVSRHTAEADLDDIVLFNVHQKVWERLVGVGKIDMMSASDGGPDVVFSGVCDPFQVKEIITSLRAQRNRR